MPFLLRRPRQQDAPPTRSWVDTVKSKILGHDSKRVTKTCHDIYYSLFFCHPMARRRGSSKDLQHVHPIMTLPPELVSHVFVLAAEDDVMTPVVVSHVCRAWRFLALRTPTLWRRISLDPRLRMWTERIPRSRACTLDVEILPQVSIVGTRARRQYLDARMVQLYMHMVSPYLARWRSLTIEFQHYAPYLWSAVLMCCSGDTPGLQAPRIEHISLKYRSNDDTKEYVLFNGYAPRLRSAVFDGIRVAWLPSLFANLSSLDYTHHGFTRGHDAEAELFQMLSISQRLQELRLAFPTHSFKTIDTRSCTLPPRASVYLDSLRTLSLEVSSTDIPSALLSLLARVQLRNLRALHLSSLRPGADTLGPGYFPSFLRLRKFLKVLNRLPRLRYLRLDPAWCDPAFIVGLLNFHVPRLEHLVLCAPRVDEGILGAIGDTCRQRYRVVTPPGDAPPFVVFQPLAVLEIVGSQRLTENGLLEVVRRMLGGGVIWVAEMWLKDCKAISGDVIRRAERMGVRVRVWQDGEEVKDRYALDTKRTRRRRQIH
ncbi:F-box protein [Phanerochaete sordida]|uniref:F-box protein n=1 Tax=Phanerochaete sordida TaxID=48140 RepID=A0A9P3G5A1_9APHY|nr:F-box protein [Phanerochaete sordida]